jgi:Tol biopolymer transport system component
LLVYQLDDVGAHKAITETVFTLDLGTGERTKIGSTRRGKDEFCCPDVVRWSTDRSRAVLFAGRYLAGVDLAAGSVTPAPKRITLVNHDPSHKGDRLAWVDTETGTAETIVIGDLKGHELSRLALPTGSWGANNLAWSPDDRNLAVTTQRPIAVAMAGLGGDVFCCSIDHGIGANHLLIVSVDGSATRDLLDDESAVAHDQAQPFPTPPPGEKAISPTKAARSFAPLAWSPDGRTILLTSTVCEGTYSYHHQGACHGGLSLVDAETGEQTALIEDIGIIGGADWSPDGRRVAFILKSGDQDRLFIVDRDGQNLRALSDTTAPLVDRSLVDWSPDGTWLAIWRWGPERPDNPDRFDVWAISLGGEMHLVAEHATAAW